MTTVGAARNAILVGVLYDFVFPPPSSWDVKSEYAYTLYGHDVGRVVANALSMAEPLSPTGVKHGLEKVKYLPAATGSPGVRITFGKWTRNGWDGAGVWTGRIVAPDFRSTELRHRVGR